MSSEKSTLVDGSSVNDGDAPDFAWVTDDKGGVIGWEGSFLLPAGVYEGVEIHVNHGADTSSTGKSNAKGVDQTKTINTDDLLTVDDKPTLQVEFTEPLQPIDTLTPQACTNELKRQTLVAGQNTDVALSAPEWKIRMKTVMLTPWLSPMKPTTAGILTKPISG